MRKSIARAGSMLVAGIAVTSVVGFSAAGAASAKSKPDATTACGGYCTDIYSAQLGPNVLLNAYVPGDTGSGAKAGQLINMNQGGNNHPNEDFRVAAIGTVKSQCRSFNNPDGILASNSVLCNRSKQFYKQTAYEIELAPFGNTTGLCAGTTGTPYAGLSVRLTPCGTTEGTLVVQYNQQTTSTGAFPGTYYNYISGATNTFSDPYVFTVNTGTSGPANQLQLQQANPQKGAAPTNQLFATEPGPF